MLVMEVSNPRGDTGREPEGLVIWGGLQETPTGGRDMGVVRTAAESTGPSSPTS
jgi:hypothetical protein